jgi:hypothetical protein
VFPEERDTLVDLGIDGKLRNDFNASNFCREGRGEISLPYSNRLSCLYLSESGRYKFLFFSGLRRTN